ncbi:hypothetical protein [Pseudomonas sp. CM27]|uniref:hypothetical protein n=1 Tax=Pseudomonas sp. CM27 TaxID=2738452 RepID=UPI0015538CD6|nr:hypothetical protein [Pseudomonas sp. CM27]NQD72905.1 hypothetical protein [Pseudomonas sp. CM27]
MILITSAAYVDAEFQAEFGKLPPAFLPVGNKRLFTLQATAIKKAYPSERIWLSIPESHAVSVQDFRTLDSLEVSVLKVPDGLSLADSILFSLNVIGANNTTVRILHGDTYLPQIPVGDNLLALASTQDYYNWEVEKSNPSDELVWCGYFAFSNPQNLIKNLTICRGEFVGAVREYSASYPTEKILLDNWFDLGHINTFYKTRAKITTQRSFNELKITDTHVYKSGTPHHKIVAEGTWFKSLPVSLKGFVPQLMDQGIKDGKPFYVIEFLYLAPLNELFVNGNNPKFFWKKIFRHIKSWLQACTENFPAEQLSHVQAGRQDLIARKSAKRLASFCDTKNYNMHKNVILNGKTMPSINDVMEHCISLALAKPTLPGILHGDLCFSNMLYDSRADMLKLIDPRAIDFNEQFTLYGDVAYDIAKANHSIIGLYDFIIAGAFSAQQIGDLNFVFEIFKDDRIDRLQSDYLDEQLLPNTYAADYMPLTILLFLSMLPLHADNEHRQLALFANAFRLYDQFLIEAN